MERFWSKIEKRGPDECWPWMARTDRNGYGTFRLGKMRKAHQVSYELTKGPIPDGLQIRHTCHNRLCQNPAHLLVGTGLENADDSRRAGRLVKGEQTGSSKLKDIDVEQLVTDYLTGDWTQPQLAEKYGLSNGYISRLLSGKYRSTNPRQVEQARSIAKAARPKGENLYCSKLKEDDILDIFDMRRGGLSQQVIADAKNVSRETIRDILNGKKWRHLTGDLLAQAVSPPGGDADEDDQ